MHPRLVLFGSQALAAEPPTRPCKEHPALVGPCFTVHGRLATWNGNPTFRISRLGTNRILGVSDQRFFREGYENLPTDSSPPMTRALRGEVAAKTQVPCVCAKACRVEVDGLGGIEARSGDTVVIHGGKLTAERR